MNREVFVYIELDNKPRLVGRLWTHSRNKRESATFEYDKSWLEFSNHFSLEPALSLGPGPFHTRADKMLFGAFGDSAPDRWGRVLMRRAEQLRARKENRTSRTLTEIDYLLMVNDKTREGALRFSLQKEGSFLADDNHTPIPPLFDLPKLLNATENVGEEKETEEDLRLLLAPGSSLGGARPKASVQDKDGHLAIAKFPHKMDIMNVVLWEALALTLAARANISVPTWRIETVANKPVLISRRFDRNQSYRIPFLSAMSMLDAKDNEMHSYLEIVDALRQYSANPTQDIKALWRRIVFNILISNTDDHLRNHGFLYVGQEGWRLSPAFDLNPVPIEIKPRILSTAITLDDATASIELAMSVINYFGISAKEAKTIVNEVSSAVSNWRKEAKALGLKTNEINKMASAFSAPH